QIDTKLEAAVEDPTAQQVLPFGLVDGGSQALDRKSVFAPNVNKALSRSDGISGDGHAFQNAVRIALQHAAIHECAGVTFIGIANDVLHGRDLLRHQVPLEPGRVASATSASQAARLYFFDHVPRGHSGKRFGERLVAARGDVVDNSLGV